MIFRLLNFQYLDHLCIFNTAFQSFYVNEGCEFLVIKRKVSDYIICELLPNLATNAASDGEKPWVYLRN